LESRPRSRSADIHRPIPRHRKIHAASTPRPIVQGPDIHVGALRCEHRHVLLALHFGNSCKCLAATPRLPGAAPVTWGRSIPPAIEHHLERQGVAVFKEMKVRARHARHGCQDAGTLAAEHAGSGTRWQRNTLAAEPAGKGPCVAERATWAWYVNGYVRTSIEVTMRDRVFDRVIS
jgi:hypothetical protein